MLLAAVLHRENPCMVLELAQHGDLQSAMVGKGRRLPRSLALRFLKDVACGVEYLHSRDPVFVHHGMKTENVLLVGTGAIDLATAKLAEVSC